MAQHLKDEVQNRIVEAALAVFARKGFHGTTMAEIGQAAGISAGNIYRYYQNKDVLFSSLITDEFVGQFVNLVRRRIHSLEGVGDYRKLPPTAAFHSISGELLDFCIENRLRMIVLLGRPDGTRYDGFPKEMVDRLVKSAISHFEALRPGLRVTKTMRFGLEQIYRNLISTTVRILEQFHEPKVIRRAVEDYSRYHLGGLNSLFE